MTHSFKSMSKFLKATTINIMNEKFGCFGRERGKHLNDNFV